MAFIIQLTLRARSEYALLETNPALIKRLKAVSKAIAMLESNPRHPGLRTHKFNDRTGPQGQDVFEAYAENNTPGAYRIFWHYGPDKDVITILAITQHP